jgi:glycosyltransferase involved in cell wall biosynthesis
MSRIPRRVVYLLMSYNQEAFIAHAVRSALSQTYEPIEIWISDDCSDDSTFEIICNEVAQYVGPHKITLNRNKVRLGSVEHLSAIVDKIGYDAFYVTAHGDDIAHPDRTEIQVSTWHRTRASMVTCGVNWLTFQDPWYATGDSRFVAAEEIIQHGWLSEMLGATLAFDPQILSLFKPLNAQVLRSGLDHVLPLRAAAMNGLYFVAEKLIDYRIHASNMSNLFRDRTQSALVRDERHAAYELALGSVQSADMLTLARRKMLSVRQWRLVSAMRDKQRFRSSRLKELRESISFQSHLIAE